MQSSEQEVAVLVWQSKIIVLFMLLAGTELGCGVSVNMKGNVNELLQLIF